MDEKGKVASEMGWNDKGKIIEGYIYEREAKFPGGQRGWMAYLEKMLNNNTRWITVPHRTGIG